MIVWESLIGENLQCDISVDVKLWIGGSVEVWLGTDDGTAGLGQVRGMLGWPLVQVEQETVSVP